MFAAIKDSLQELYLNDPRPWLIDFSGGKDSTMVASLIYEVDLKTWTQITTMSGTGAENYATLPGQRTYAKGFFRVGTQP